ncbi:MAG: hypothetical protein JRI23_28880, partial [Deltaproteobacteria bacterium]|nr:hypothetical protein [Deltaproteobacteria bacterium]MBW2536138.1 hypothetical protein [Deltaproteobacteria bacterium]
MVEHDLVEGLRPSPACGGTPSPLRPGAPAVLLIAAWVTAFLTGCAGHEVRVEAALDALDRGAPAEAVAALNEEMEVASTRDLPADLEGDNALLLLERATVLQSMDRYGESARDFGAADKAIEVLELSANAADDVGRYLFSDDVGRYRAPPFEKLLINTLNAMNYLARRDLSGARVEARRLAVIQRYFGDQGERTALLGLGSYLAGFAFEKSGRHAEALNHYDEALQYAAYRTLRDPLRVLTKGEPKTRAIDRLVAGAGPLPSIAETGQAELCIVVGYGRVPRKEPVRIPIGLALTLVSGHLSPHDHARANELAAKGLVTWVNFPRLGKSRGRHAIPTLAIDGRPVGLEHALDIEQEVRKAWEENEGTVILAAITRLLARAAAGEITQAATGAAADSGVVGLLAGLATTATLAAADTPDTRSWTTLPANVAIARVRVRPGRHHLRISARGITKDYRVDVRPRDWAFIAMT